MDRSLLMYIHDTLNGRHDDTDVAHVLKQVKERLDEPVTNRITRALGVLQSECPRLAETMIMAQGYNNTVAKQRDDAISERDKLRKLVEESSDKAD